jgi:hypothetical protein
MYISIIIEFMSSAEVLTTLFSAGDFLEAMENLEFVYIA